MVTGVAVFLRALASIVLVMLLLSGRPAAGQPIASSQWGLLGEMAAQDFESDGIIVTARWVAPGKHLQLDYWSTDWSGNFKQSWEFKIDPVTGIMSYYLEGREGKDGWSARAEADGSISVSERSGGYKPWLFRAEGGVIRLQKRKLKPLDPAGKQGQRLAKLVAQGRIVAIGTPLTAVEAAPGSKSSSVGMGSEVKQATLGAAGRPEQELVAAEIYNYFRGIIGEWSNGPIHYSIREEKGRIRVDLRHQDGGVADPQHFILSKDKVYYMGRSVSQIEGGYFVKKWAAFFPVSLDEFKIRKGKLVEGRFVEVYQDGPVFEGTFRRLNSAASAQFMESFSSNRLARSQNSSGDNGLLGGLIMGGVAAASGGNAEQVMGMAMKGVELTTDNEMSRNVLAGQGDAMVASGTQRMIDQSAGSSGSSSSGSLASSSSPSATPGTPINNARPRRKMYSWCWATAGSRAAYMSSVGSRDLSVDEQQQWRSAMESEFKQQIRGAYDLAQCDIDDDSDFSHTRSSIAADNPAQVQWAPH